MLYDSRQIQIERLADERWPSKQPWKRLPGLAAHLLDFHQSGVVFSLSGSGVTDQPQKFQRCSLVAGAGTVTVYTARF